ncbi:MAG: GntR family transcriptional regulator [Kiloniellaceae bacterium]
MSQSQPAQARAAGPLYLQVASTIRRRIETGIWAPGGQIPTLDELAAEFSMARVTLRQALALLEDEGLIRRHQGRGTFVADRLPERQWLRLGADWPALLETVSTLKPRMLVLEDSARQPALGPGEGKPAPAYKFMRRVHMTVEGTPYCLVSIFLDRRVHRKAPAAFETQTVLPLLESRGGVTIASAHQTLTIGSADAEAARHLALPLNGPIAEVRRVITDSSGCAVYVADLIYRGDVVKLDIQLLGDPKR